MALVPGQVAKRENWSAPRPSESVSGLVASATGGVGSGFGIRRVGLSAENWVWFCYFCVLVHSPHCWRCFSHSAPVYASAGLQSGPSRSVPGSRQRHYLPLTSRCSTRPMAAGRPFHCGFASITRAPLSPALNAWLRRSLVWCLGAAWQWFLGRTQPSVWQRFSQLIWCSDRGVIRHRRGQLPLIQCSGS